MFAANADVARVAERECAGRHRFDSLATVNGEYETIAIPRHALKADLQR
jgi:hypothetical protein